MSLPEGTDLELPAVRLPLFPLPNVVNVLAAHLDLPALRKLQLLAEPLPERALSVLGILRARQKVLDLLRPYRHLAAGAEYN